MPEISDLNYLPPEEGSARGNADAQAEGSAERFRLLVSKDPARWAERLTVGPLRLDFSTYKRSFVRSAVIPQQATEADAVEAIAHAMAPNDWRDVEVVPIEATPNPEAAKPGWFTTKMAAVFRLDAKAARAIDDANGRHVRNPHFPHESE